MSRRDEARFRAIYDRTYDRLWAFVLRRLPDGEASRDVVADTYLAVWRRIKDVPLDERAADAWVFATARRMIANSRRGATRRGRLLERIRQQPVDLIVDVSAAADTDRSVLRALAELSPAEREILALRFWEDMEVDQIARILGCSKNAAAIRLTRARQSLRDSLELITKSDRIADNDDAKSDNNRTDEDDRGGER